MNATLEGQKLDSYLETRFASRKALAGVVGLGYAGLPLALEIAHSGFRVIGVDTDHMRVKAVNSGASYIGDIPQSLIGECVASSSLQARTDFAALEQCDVISICVPTPLKKTRSPDLTHVVQATRSLSCYVKNGALVILESTTYPGTTEEAVLPILEESGRRVGDDFFLCYSPERVDPGNVEFGTKNVPKVISGVTSKCLRMGQAFYGCVMDTLVPVSSTAAAETAKLLENTFRMVNVGLANETAILCDRIGIDVWEVIDAAATKPFGFMPFYPGPGLGGHCVPVDPHFLSWRSRQTGYEPRLIQLASEINREMPRYIVARIQSALNDRCKSVNGSRIHLVGVAYKPEVSDTRESPAVDIARILDHMGASLTYSDPHVPDFRVGDVELKRGPLLACAVQSDIAVLLTNHKGVDYSALLDACPQLLDTRNAFRGVTAPNLLRL